MKKSPEKDAPTPGPWEMRSMGAYSCDPDIKLYGVGPKINGAIWFIAEQVEESDARLISAAPDLLAAAKYAACPSCPHNRCEMLRKAIAKAEEKQ